MTKVFLHPDRQTQRDVENALRKLKKAVETDGTLKELQKRR